MSKIEILAPVGSEEMLRAAVFSGADAVYLGFSGFNARTGAGNFDADSLKEAVRFCHARGVAVHVALNTTVYGGELPALEQAIRAVAASGADAVICQDLVCKTRLPETYHLTCLDGLQVLCPGRRGELGTIRINAQLRELLNPPADDKAEVKSMGCVLRVGDKVMHNHNNYDITWVKDNGEVGTGVFNGDIGILEKVNRAEGTVAVRYDNRVATYTREDLQDLELAYAITVHKSQGSEFDAVVLTVFGQQRQLCYRNLLYTAITRAKKLLILVGDEQTLWDMIENNRKTLRYSALTAFLTGEASGHADA